MNLIHLKGRSLSPTGRTQVFKDLGGKVSGLFFMGDGMREIRFRAWCKKDEMMYYGIERGITFDDGSHYDFIRFLGDQEPGDYHEWAVMQLTGLLDKNVDDIYEGDIVRMHQFLFYGNEVESEITGIIGWDEYGLTLESVKNGEVEEYTGHEAGEGTFPLNSFYGLHEESWTVLGNIYENPEMVE